MRRQRRGANSEDGDPHHIRGIRATTRAPCTHGPGVCERPGITTNGSESQGNCHSLAQMDNRHPRHSVATVLGGTVVRLAPYLPSKGAVWRLCHGRKMNEGRKIMSVKESSERDKPPAPGRDSAVRAMIDGTISHGTGGANLGLEGTIPDEPPASGEPSQAAVRVGKRRQRRSHRPSRGSPRRTRRSGAHKRGD